jgi:hypothetical protein
VYDLGAQSSVDFDYSNNILSMAFEALDGVRFVIRTEFFFRFTKC